MSKVITTNFGIIHQHAQCEECAWSGNADLSIKELKASAKQHCRETGHTTTVETGDSFEYRTNPDS